MAAFEFEHSFVGTCVQRRSESAPEIHEKRIDIILPAAFLIRAYLLVALNLLATTHLTDGGVSPLSLCVRGLASIFRWCPVKLK